MKESTLQTLITARTLFTHAESDCAIGDRYRATAGLILLQDAVELIFYAALIEKGADEKTAVEKLDFDQMIGALSKFGVQVPKSGTLKAMNKLRVTAKHYGQLMEPTTIQNHLNAAKYATDAVLQQAIGKPLYEIFLTELVSPSECRDYLDRAAAALARDEYFECLLSTRKAFFIAFEEDYCVYHHRDIPRNSPPRGLLAFIYGRKAPYWSRNAEWIQENIRSPVDYIQIDPDVWRIDALEWGINTQTLANIQQLTPKVIRFTSQGDWFAEHSAAFLANSANRENAAMCLDLTIEVVRRWQEHSKGRRSAGTDQPFNTPPAYIGQALFERPDTQSKIILTLTENHQYTVENILDGFESGKKFYHIYCNSPKEGRQWGYIEQL